MDFEDIMAALGTIVLITLLIIVLCLASPKIVSEEKIEVEAIITEVRHTFPIVTQYVKRVEDNDIYFEYEGIKGNWDTDYETYEAYKDKVGEPIKCYLVTRVYENGKAELKLVAVDDYEERN